MELLKKKFFYYFLAINGLLWSVICLFRNIMGDDALEAISWGELADFGTNKHPPLSGWIMSAVYHLFGEHDYSAVKSPLAIALSARDRAFLIWRNI